MAKRYRLVGFACLMVGGVACGGAQLKKSALPTAGSGVLAGFSLLTLAKSEAGKPGQAVKRMPQGGMNLDGLLVDNGCAEHLSEQNVQEQMHNEFNTFVSIGVTAKGNYRGAMLGIEVDAAVDTDVHVFGEVTREVRVEEGQGYAACCEADPQSCKAGYVKSYVYGAGEIEVGKRVEVNSQGQSLTAGGEVGVKFKSRETKKFSGWFAALVVENDYAAEGKIKQAAGWTTAASVVGFGLAGAGAGLGVAARNRSREQDTPASEFGALESQATAGSGMLVGGLTLGAAAGIAAVALWVRHGKIKRGEHGRSSAIWVAPAPQRGGAGMAMGGKF